MGRNGNQMTCIIPSSSSKGTNITCSVHDYFPNITLSIYHWSSVLTPLLFSEWVNQDGTKHKSLTVNAVPSRDPYICEVSGVPGYQVDEIWSVAILVKSSSDVDGFLDEDASRTPVISTPDESTTVLFTQKEGRTDVVVIGMHLFYTYYKSILNRKHFT